MYITGKYVHVSFRSKVFDTVVQKGSWNYHKLNISQSEGERKCRVKRETCGSFNKDNEKIIDGLRLRKGGKVIKSQNLLSVINQSGRGWTAEDHWADRGGECGRLLGEFV